MDEARFQRLVQRSGLPETTCSTHKLYQFLPMVEQDEKAYKTVIDSVSEERRQHHFLTLTGGPGRGKTHLAIGLGWYWLENYGLTVKYWHVEALLDAMRREYKQPPMSEHGYPMLTEFERACGVGLLILDDLGAEKPTEWVVAKLDELVDTRYVNKRLTVITTNLKPGELQPRIASRLSEGVVITLKGPDYRKKIADTRKTKHVDATGRLQ